MQWQQDDESPEGTQYTAVSQVTCMKIRSLVSPQAKRTTHGFSTQPLTEMSTRSIKIIMFLGSKVRRVRKADNLTAIYEPFV
jgi:hypothetical protein